MMELNFKEWFKETSAIYDPNVKPTTFNWWGAPESTIKPKKKNKSKKKAK